MEFLKRTQEDAELVRSLAEHCYRTTFSPYNTEEDMDAYAGKAFALPVIEKELGQPGSEVYFAYCEGGLAGFIKVNEAPYQSDINDPASLELERIYLLAAYQGNGFGQELLGKAVSLARSKQKEYLWLGVWEGNKRAIRFYTRQGFYRFGTHAFMMGSDEQTDWLMRLDIPDEGRSMPVHG